MEKNTLEKMSFKEKEQTLSAIFKEYEKAKYHLQYDDIGYQTSHVLMVKEDDGLRKVNYEQKLLDHIAKQNSYKSYVRFIDEALLHLGPTHRLVIEREFINKTSFYWWESYFSRSTFYRHKKEAMDLLLPWLLS